MFRNVDWSERDVHMFERHGVTTSQTEEALADPERVVLNPDYASRSGQSVRVIGYAGSIDHVLSVILVVEEGHVYGASGWRSNLKDRTIYHQKEVEP